MSRRTATKKAQKDLLPSPTVSSICVPHDRRNSVSASSSCILAGRAPDSLKYAKKAKGVWD
ncbi:hypothetical protein [Treponema parvum]|uniref:hypothetical protein n=1 Tax=Treponema parvum TaxID=138851 RepID=UPI001AEC2267|nr:hypothetical protein [Treponema parvum]QTQ16586.1 hypothetical protein HXT04_07725 [Treponema parvum]